MDGICGGRSYSSSLLCILALCLFFSDAQNFQSDAAKKPGNKCFDQLLKSHSGIL